MNRKIPLILMGIGAGLALLICTVSALLYGRIYYFDGYAITTLLWIGATICGLYGIVAFVLNLIFKDFNSYGKLAVVLGIICLGLCVLSLPVMYILNDVRKIMKVGGWIRGLGNLTLTTLVGGFALIITGALVQIKAEHNNKLTEKDRELAKAYVEIFGKPGDGFYKELGELCSFANKNIEAELRQYQENNGIVSVLDTSSDLGSCGVSETHFYMNLDKTSPDAIRSLDELSKYYTADNSYNLKRELAKYVQLKKEGCKSKAERIALGDIVVFRVEGSRHISTNISDAGPNIGNAVAGALIAGSAGAIIGSRVGVQQTVTTTTVDDRKILLVHSSDGIIVTRKVQSKDIDKTIEALRKLIPQKEESIINLNTKEEQHSVQPSVADELKQFKELLDSGVISQEEFEAKKKQILGL